MDDKIYYFRLRNLRNLVEKVGGRPEASRRLDISYNLLTQYIGKNPTINIGEKMARKIEGALSLPFGWLDQDHDNLDQIIIPEMDINGVIKYPENDKVFFIPILDVQYLDHNGTNIETKEKIMLLREDIESLGMDVNQAVCVKAPNEAMSPTIKQGDKLVLDLRKNNIGGVENREIYAIRLVREILIARLYVEARESIKVSFDNPNTKLRYPDKVVTSGDDFSILGKVVLLITSKLA